MKRFTRQIVLWAAFALFPVVVQGQWIDDYQGVLNHGDIQTLDSQNPYSADGWYVLSGTGDDPAKRRDQVEA